MTSPIRVKFITRIRLPDGNMGADFLRRFPNREPIQGNCRFIFDRDCRDYDWLVVYDDLPRDTPAEALACPRENTLLITGEPSSITHYGKHFLKQFGHVLTSQEPWALDHPGVIRSQPGLLWYYGGPDDRGTYDSLITAKPPEKSKLISTVCSNKGMRHTLHSQRLAFTKRLMNDLPELDVFGYGMRDLENKADAIDPYRFHLAIENHSGPHHWTEKLADAFLGYAVPIYFGCTNPGDYFPEESFIHIDIRNYEAALERVKSVIRDDEYHQRLPAVIEARERVLKEYSTFARTASLIAKHHSFIPRAGGTIRARRDIRRRHPLALPAELIAKLKLKIHPRV